MAANSLSNWLSEKPVDAVEFEVDAAVVAFIAMPLREDSAFVKCTIGEMPSACDWPNGWEGDRARSQEIPILCSPFTQPRVYRELAGTGLPDPSLSHTICNWTVPPDS